MASELWLPTAPANDKKAMRDFSRGFSLILCIFFLGLIPWLFETAIPLWPLYVSGVLLVLGQFIPVAVYPIYRVWMVVASVLAWINTRIIMLIAFYLLMVPIGLIMQALGKLQYKKVKWDKKPSQSYWIKRDNPPKPENLKEPF